MKVTTSERYASTTTEECVIVGGAESHVRGSLQVSCEFCPAKIWLSPSSQEVLNRRGDLPTSIMCLECAIEWSKRE